MANYEWMAAPILVFFAIFLLPLYLNARIGTVPEFLEYRYDRRVQVYLSLLTLIANVVVDTAGTLFAGAIVLTVFIPELDIVTAAFLLAAVAGAYPAAGGLAAVVYTDVLQAIILLAGSAIVTLLAFAQLDFSWSRLVAETPPEHLTLLLPLGDDNLPWLGTLVGVPVLAFLLLVYQPVHRAARAGCATSSTHAAGRCWPVCSSCRCCFSWCCPA